MNILFIHKGFPGQFKHLVPKLKARGDQLTCIQPSNGKIKLKDLVNYYPYKLTRGNAEKIHYLALETESKVLRGEAVGIVANELKINGYKPDLIIAHPGWGEALFMNDIWPEIPELHYVEFAYRAKGADSDFTDKYALKQTWQEKARGRMKNASVLLNLQSMSWGVTPTTFQKSTLPQWAQNKTTIIHDGIDTEWAQPDPLSSLRLPNDLVLDPTNEIITFVNRTFEPYRGIHIFLEALIKVQKVRPNAHVLLIGEDTPKVSYGARRKDGKGWLTHLKEELGDSINWEKVHCLGKVPHKILRNIFQISTAHVYLTYPFVLSWSMLEAMSCGALVIGSNTEPVKEVIQHGKNGILFPFGDVEQLSEQLIKALSSPEKYKAIRKSARKTIEETYQLEKCLQEQLSLIDAVARKEIGF